MTRLLLDLNANLWDGRRNGMPVRRWIGHGAVLAVLAGSKTASQLCGKEFLAALLLVLLCTFGQARSEEQYYRDIYPDTWVATDALGRSTPDPSVVGPPKTDQRRVVGIFYVTWHQDRNATRKAPYTADVTKVLAADPSA